MRHRHIVTIYEIGMAPPHEFIARELVQGRPLDALIGLAERNAPVPAAR